MTLENLKITRGCDYDSAKADCVKELPEICEEILCLYDNLLNSFKENNVLKKKKNLERLELRLKLINKTPQFNCFGSMACLFKAACNYIFDPDNKEKVDIDKVRLSRDAFKQASILLNKGKLASSDLTLEN